MIWPLRELVRRMGREDLEDLVVSVAELLFVEEDDGGRAWFDRDKEWSVDQLYDLYDVLGWEGLAPEGEGPYLDH
jgi:hypothetical protein